ncbi:unnamed protein product [Amoebophrya sp. A120]|nr:unnamed protein product [Amoebophrya sp. A120]|eukprot:GSA120T00008673001.1
MSRMTGNYRSHLVVSPGRIRSVNEWLQRRGTALSAFLLLSQELDWLAQERIGSHRFAFANTSTTTSLIQEHSHPGVRNITGVCSGTNTPLREIAFPQVGNEVIFVPELHNGVFDAAYDYRLSWYDLRYSSYLSRTAIAERWRLTQHKKIDPTVTAHVLGYHEASYPEILTNATAAAAPYTDILEYPTVTRPVLKVRYTFGTVCPNWAWYHVATLEINPAYCARSNKTQTRTENGGCLYHVTTCCGALETLTDGHAYAAQDVAPYEVTVRSSLVKPPCVCPNGYAMLYPRCEFYNTRAQACRACRPGYGLTGDFTCEWGATSITEPPALDVTNAGTYNIRSITGNAH